MQVSQKMTSYTQPNVDQMWWKKIHVSQPICIRNVILYSKILLHVLHNMSSTEQKAKEIFNKFMYKIFFLKKSGRVVRSIHGRALHTGKYSSWKKILRNTRYLVVKEILTWKLRNLVFGLKNWVSTYTQDQLIHW